MYVFLAGKGERASPIPNQFKVFACPRRILRQYFRFMKIPDWFRSSVFHSIELPGSTEAVHRCSGSWQLTRAKTADALRNADFLWFKKVVTDKRVLRMHLSFCRGDEAPAFLE